MLRIAIPNKGSLSETAAEMLLEAGYTGRRDPRALSVRDERNEEIARQVVNVGSLQGAEKRTLNVTIESSESKS